MVAGARDGAPAAPVVDERVAGLLQHALLVADDDLGGAELEEPLEPVVAVDDAPVEVVEVGRGEAAAVELDHGPQVRRDDRQHREDHPLGTGPRAPEGLDEAEALDGLLAAHAGGGADLGVQRGGKALEIEAGDALADGLGAHAGAEEPLTAADAAAVLLVEVTEVPAVEGRLRQEIARLEAADLVLGPADLLLEALGVDLEALLLGLEGGAHLEPGVLDALPDGGLLLALAGLDVVVDALHELGRQLAQLCRGGLAGLLAGGHEDLTGLLEDDGLLGRCAAEGLERGLRGLLCLHELGRARLALLLPLPLELRELGVELVGELVDVRREAVLELRQRRPAATAATLGLRLELREEPPARLLVDPGDDVLREVEDALEVARADVEQDAEPAGRALEVPDVADRAGQLDVTHALASDLGARDLDAALVADDALVADPLVLPAVALPVPRGTEDALVEEPVLLRPQGPVVDGLGLRDLALRPVAHLVRRRQRDADGVEVVDLEHRSPSAARRWSVRDARAARSVPRARRPLRRQSSNPARLMPPRSGSG